MPLFGVDVSVHNSGVNYTAMKYADVHFAMVKATQGHSLYTKDLYNFTDSKFSTHMHGFIKAGIPVGTYHFFTATTADEAYAEADCFLKAVRPYKDKIALFMACDAEVYGNKWLENLTRDELTYLIDIFCKRVESEGYKACHYTNTDHIRNYIDLEKLDYPVWHAHHIGEGTVSRPTASGKKLAIHQYTSTGRIIGMPGNFDLNFGYGPVARQIIFDRTPLLPMTLDYMESYATGENILIKIAAKLVNPSLKAIHNPIYERLVPLIRYHCALTPEETVHLTEYKFAVELFTKLYNAMVK